jgi:RHS repeat-associated protein
LWAYSNGSKYWDELAVESLTAVPANTPTATNTATTTPTATPDPSGTAVIQRSSYAIAGHTVALHVVEKDANGVELTNTFYYFHTDHLGSTSAMSDDTNSLVSGSTSRFAPFGTYRTEPTANLADRGFTGHMENRTVGLTYMNARFYLSSLGRFASADSIVPDLDNPQSFNKYSYTYNNFINYTDPTGHFTCEDMPWECSGENWADDGTTLSANDTLASFCAQSICEGEGIEFVTVVIQGEAIQLPYHVFPDYDSSGTLFPWEAPADVLYAEHSSLHPSKYNNQPQWRKRFDQTWRPEAIGILQTMINRAESAAWDVNTPSEAALAEGQYANAGRNVDDIAWQESYALSFEVNMMDLRIDQPYDSFAHQDLNDVRGFKPDDRNAICCNERTAFGGPGYKDYYVVFFTTLGKGPQ